MPLFDSDAEALITFGETGITGSGSNKAAMLIAGVTPSNTGSFIKVSELGDARVTGSVGITESVPLTIGAFSTNVTGAVRIVQTNVTQSVTGSVFAFNNATQRLWTTGSVAVTSVASPVTVVQGASGSQFWKVSGSVQTIPSGIQQVTGTVGVTSIASPVTIGNFPVTQSVYVGQINPNTVQTVTGVVGVSSVASPVTVSQGLSGSQFWKITGSVATIPTGIQQVTGTILANQGTAGPSGSGWNVILRDEEGNRAGTGLYPVVVRPADYSSTPYLEWKVSQPFSVVDFVNTYEINDLEVGTSTTGSQTSVIHLPQQSAIRLATSGAAPTNARMKTHTAFPYQAGKSMTWRNVIYHSNAGVAGQIRRWGVFDDENGIFLELSGTNLNFTRRTSAGGTLVETRISQSQWQLDMFDGNGSSGFLDITKTNMYEIQYQWYGAGRIELYINRVFATQLDLFNTESLPWLGNATLPLAWEVENRSGSPAGSMTTIGASLSVDNGNPSPQFSFAVINSSPKTIGATETPLIAIRPKASFKGQENRVLILPKTGFVSTNGKPIRFRFYYRPASLTGASWQDVNTNNSAVEWDEAATTITTGSQTQLVFGGLIGDSIGSERIDVSDLFTFLGRKLRKRAFTGEQEIILITAQNIGGGTTSVEASFTWTEIR